MKVKAARVILIISRSEWRLASGEIVCRTHVPDAGGKRVNITSFARYSARSSLKKCATRYLSQINSAYGKGRLLKSNVQPTNHLTNQLANHPGKYPNFQPTIHPTNHPINQPIVLTLTSHKISQLIH